MIAKVARPKVSEAFPRHRLFKAIDAYCNNRPILWISGFPGSGKTTLAAGYLKARKLSCLWYQIDEADEDIGTFITYMGLAAQKAVPWRKKPLPLFTPEYVQRVPAFTRRYFEDLFSSIAKGRSSRAAKGSQRQFFLVFDNYQNVPADSGFHKMLANGLDILPEIIRVIFISRTEPPPPFARMRSRSRVAFIGWDELRLTPSESEAIMQRLGWKELVPETLNKLHALTDGWPAGLIMLSERLKRDDNALRAPEALPREGIFNYFAGEVFDKMDRAIRDFLMQTAFLSHMTTRMAERLSGQHGAARILSELHHNNFFTDRRLVNPPVYSYHPLFREFLLFQAERWYPRAKNDQIKQQAAGLLERIGRIEDAAALYLQVADWRGIEDLIRKSAPQLVAQGRHKTLAKWIESILSAHPEASPVLVFWLGIARLPYNPGAARAELEKVFALCADRDPLKLRAWSAIIDTYIFEWNDFTPLDRWIGWMEGALESGLAFENREIEARVVTGLSAALILRQPHYPEINTWIERTLILARELPDINFKVQAYSFIVIFNFWRGDLVRLRAMLSEIEILVSLPEASPLSKLIMFWMEGFTDIWLAGSYDTALEKIDAALAYAEKHGVITWNYYMLLFLRVYCCLAREDLASAEGALALLAGLLDGSSKHIYCQYYYFLAWYNFLQNEKEVAQLQAATALEYADASGYFFPQILCSIANARIFHVTGNPGKAASFLKQAKSLCRKTGSHVLEYIAWLVEALLFIDGGRRKAGLDCLQRGMTLGRQRGYPAPPLWCEPAFMAEVCAHALEHNIEAEYAVSMICKQRLVPVHRLSVDASRKWPWPVKVRTFGRFDLFRWGEPVPFSAKGRKKPLDMFKILISLGGEDIPKERITDILWPDADGDLALKSFNTTLHRLRQLVGEKRALCIQEGRVTLDRRYCWVDALYFLERAAELETQWPKEPSPGILLQAESLIDLFRGPYLEGTLEEPWVIAFREQLQRKCLQLLGKIGKYQEGRAALDQAVVCYEKGLEVDPLSEDFYQNLMVCYHNLGRLGKVVRTYQRCHDVLGTALGVRPSERLRRLFENLSSGLHNNTDLK